MALPRKLKNMNLFNDGLSYLGQVTEVVPPKLSRAMEDYRAGGMNAPIKVDNGQEGMEIEATCGGFMRDVFLQFGLGTHNSTMLRFAGAYQRDDTGDVDSVELVVRGRVTEIDQGNAKVGGDSEFKWKMAVSYYLLLINGVPIVEIDVVNMIEVVGGVDRLADQRRAIGA